MVSGFVASPYDHDRICSGEASEMRTAVKLLTSSTQQLLPSLHAFQVDPQAGRFKTFLRKGHAFLIFVQHLAGQSETLQLLDQDLERLRDARLQHVLAFDDGLIRLHAAHDVVALDGEQLLENVRGAVGLECPHLHLSEALTAELRLAAQRLLSDEGVWPGGTSVDLVLDQVHQLHQVDVADGYWLVERLTRPAGEQALLPVDGWGDLPHLRDLVSALPEPLHRRVADPLFAEALQPHLPAHAPRP